MRLTAVLILALVMYIGSYSAFRQTNTEVWPRDRQAYVIFPRGYGTALYYVWRPLTYADQALTKMRFHIGPHRE
jgi:hypothetical protein